MKKTKLITSLTVASALVMGSVVPAFAYSKEETVYTKLKTNGTEKTTVVSQHLINDQKETMLEDQTTLTNVKNMNGKETFKQNGETITWQTSDGQDIYYQGKTKASLPISMKVTYKLDGQKMKLKEMLGKKGKVEIKIDYTNNETKTVDGKELYVPFVVTTGTMLPTNNASHVEVTNGKVISNGSSNIIMALAAPGLSKNYNNNKDLEKFNSVTIKYDTTKFKLNSLMSVATPSLLSDTDINFDDMNEIYDNVDTLNSSFNQIISGGQALQSGLKQYASKYNEFDQGIVSLKTGVTATLTGSQSLSAGIEKITSGLTQLDSQSATLVAGAKQVFDTLLNTAQTQINNQLAAYNISIALTTDNYQKVLKGLMAQLPAQASSSIQSTLDQLNAYNQFYQGLQSYTAGVAALKEGSQSALDGSKQLTEGIATIESGSESLANASSQLKDANQQLASGSDALVEGLTLFKSKGLDKISDVLNNTVKKDVKTTEKLMDLASDYKTLTGSKEGVEASTKFIMIIDSKSKK